LQPLALAFALMTHLPITVVVESDEDPAGAQRLRSDLVMRLLEEGFALSAVSEQRLIVATTPEGGVVVKVEGDEELEPLDSWTIEAGPEAAVRLEVVHRSMELVRRLPPRSSEREDALRVSLEARDIDGRSTQPSLAIIDALIDRGTIVVPPNLDATWRLCLLSDGTRWAHMRVGGEETCEAAFVLLARADATPEADLLNSIARLSFEEPATDVLEEEAALADPDPSLASGNTPSEPVRRRREPTGFASLSSGVALRIDQPEAWVGLRGGLTHASGWGGALQVGFLPSRAPALTLLDTTVTVGPVWRRSVGQRLAIGVGALVGTLLHRFTFAGGSTGTHVDFVAELPVWLGWRVAGPLHVGFELGAGLAHRRREHLVDGEARWRRRAVRLSAALTLELAWGPR
jgi:hypothetical protein